MKNVSLEKKAITYSYLAHISNSGILSRGPIDIFIPIVKKGLQLVDKKGAEKRGKNIAEIRDVLEKEYEIDIPIPTLRNILKQISIDINTKDKIYFTLNNDDSFWLKDYYFEEFDEQLSDAESDIANLQKLFAEFCEINGVEDAENKCIIKYIENNRILLSRLLSNTFSEEDASKDNFIIPAKFIKFFRENGKTVYEQIKNLYLGSIITSYLDLDGVRLEKDITLLLDTNFIISLIDLNTRESTRTCKKLLEICEKQNYSYWVLPETIEEAQQLLHQRANTLESVLISRYINEQDIYHAAQRRGLTKVDLIRIADNLESTLASFKINVIGNTQKLENIAKRSREYEDLKHIRNTKKAALHDAMAIHYIRDKRGKDFKRIEQVNCWFVNNSFSNDNKENGEEELESLNRKGVQPEIIKVDDLLNLLWLSNPSVNKDISLSEFSDIGLTTLVAFTLNEALPKSRIIKEFDDNIQKYCNEEVITGKNIHDLALSIANNQTKNIEELNSLAKQDRTKFAQIVQNVALEYEQQEKALKENLNQFITRLTQEQDNLKTKQKELETRQKELEKKDIEREIQLKKEQEEIAESNKKLIINIEEKEKQAKQDLAKLRKSVKDIDEKIASKKERYNSLDIELRNSISFRKENIHYTIELILLILIVLIIGGMGYLLYINIDVENLWNSYFTWATLAYIFGVLIGGYQLYIRAREKSYIFNRREVFLASEEKQKERWRINNPEYNRLIEEIERIEEDKRRLLN
jgi:hypothetical protein